MTTFLSQAWPWYVSGPLLGGIMLLMFYFGRKFGISSNLGTMCSLVGAGRVAEYFRFDWKSQVWNLMFLAGVILGGAISGRFLQGDTTGVISENTTEVLSALGLVNTTDQNLMPTQLFGIEALSHVKIILFLIIGGFLIGFGARYAGGCTSGHAITGLSSLQGPSLIAVIGFFAGGLVMTHLLLPYILGYAIH